MSITDEPLFFTCVLSLNYTQHTSIRKRSDRCKKKPRVFYCCYFVRLVIYFIGHEIFNKTSLYTKGVHRSMFMF